MEPSGAVADDTRDPIGHNNRVAVRVATLSARVCIVAWRRRVIIAGTWDDSRWLFDLTRRTRNEAARRRDGLHAFQMAWSPDGRRLALSGAADNTGVWSAFAQNVDGSGQIVPLGKPIEGEVHVAGWLPDNVHVVAFTFTSAVSGSSFIRIGLDGQQDTLFVDSGTGGIGATLTGRTMAGIRFDGEREFRCLCRAALRLATACDSQSRTR